jgi:hypothetical protein
VFSSGEWASFQGIGDEGFSSERANFGFGAGETVFAAWTDSLEGDRIGVSVTVATLAGTDTRWAEPTRITRGFQGRHYDPDVAGNAQGEVMLVWAWSHAGQSSILYSRWKGDQFEAPKQVQARAGMSSLPSIYAGPDGRFHLVWNHGDPAQTEVLYVNSM